MRHSKVKGIFYKDCRGLVAEFCGFRTRLRSAVPPQEDRKLLSEEKNAH